VPAAIDRHRFDWTGIDGSTVAAEYLPAGYGNGASLLAVPDRLEEAVAALVEAMQPFFGEDPVLAMYGTDHQEPLPELVEVVERANANANGGAAIELRTLGAALAGGSRTQGEARTAWTGELRSGARANVLMNVTSARIDLKAAASRAERTLERYAEPFAALHGPFWPEDFLDLAWRRVIENSAHDSICGCSADPVSAHVLVRYAEATALAHDLAVEALGPARAATTGDGTVVANPSPFHRADVVELELPVPEEWAGVSLELADGTRAPAQELSRNVPLLHREELAGREIPGLLRRRLHGRELFGRWLNGFTVEPGPRLVLELDVVQDPPALDVAALRTEIEVAAATRPDEPWEVVFRSRPRRKLAALASAPPLGWAGARAAESDVEPEHPVRVTGGRLDNGLASFDVAEIERRARVVRGFDVGDSYNYAPPQDDRLVDAPAEVRVETLEDGPVRGAISVRRTYEWPRDHVVLVDTVVELRAGEPFVRVRVSLDNPAEDQRVRVHVPLERPADSSFAEGQYAVVERGLTAEGGYGEVPLPTFPASSFVAAGGVALLLDHVSEYEVLDGELALTVLRSTGLISRNTNPYREDPAGPETPIPDAQMRGRHAFSFAIYRYDGDRPGADVLEQAERYRLPFLALEGTGEGDALSSAGGVDVERATLTALRRVDGELEARVVNETPEPAAARVGDERLELRPWEIRTVRLRG
jgi:alpha-mannosidase